MNKLNRYLLTHHPLLWNTRVLTVLAVNLVIHLLYFLGGYGAVDVKAIFDYSDIYEVGGGNMIGFSILCSLLVLIVWLVFYLRNNAFKLHYRIDRWHLAREFLLILLIVGSSISYFLSYGAGVRLHTKNITTATAFENEKDIVNKAMAFVPLQLSSYHINQSCAAQHKREVASGNNYIETTTDGNYRFEKLPDSNFSYRNYCQLSIYPYGRYGSENRNDRERIGRTVRGWLEAGARDSVLQILQKLETICRKYGIEYTWTAQRLTTWAFADSGNLVSHVINDSKPGYYSSSDVTTDPDYIESGKLVDALRFVRRAHEHDEDYWGIRLGLAYAVLSLSIFLLTYRRFSRKVFLISIVGILIWSILIGLLVAVSQGSSNTFAGFCIFLYLLFLMIGLLGLRSGSSKTATGTMFSWFAWMTPYLVMLIWMLAEHAYDENYRYGSTVTEEMIRAQQPVLYWIHEHVLLIFTINLFLSIGYLATGFNRLAKRWMEMPEE